MLIVALVLAVIGLASLVTAVVTSNELVAWVCIGASVLGVILLIIDAIRERQRAEAAAPAQPEAGETAGEAIDQTYQNFDAEYPEDEPGTAAAAEGVAGDTGAADDESPAEPAGDAAEAETAEPTPDAAADESADDTDTAEQAAENVAASDEVAPGDTADSDSEDSEDDKTKTVEGDEQPGTDSEESRDHG